MSLPQPLLLRCHLYSEPKLSVVGKCRSEGGGPEKVFLGGLTTLNRAPRAGQNPRQADVGERVVPRPGRDTVSS